MFFLLVIGHIQFAEMYRINIEQTHYWYSKAVVINCTNKNPKKKENNIKSTFSPNTLNVTKQTDKVSTKSVCSTYSQVADLALALSFS